MKEGVMANRLRKVGEETVTFDVYEVYLDPDVDTNIFDDPIGSIRDLIKAEGLEINSLAMDDVYLKNGGAAATGPPPPPTVWHCVSPPAKKSKWITIVQEGDREVE
jgi:hypothetical protein